MPRWRRRSMCPASEGGVKACSRLGEETVPKAMSKGLFRSRYSFALKEDQELNLLPGKAIRIAGDQVKFDTRNRSFATSRFAEPRVREPLSRARVLEINAHFSPTKELWLGIKVMFPLPR